MLYLCGLNINFEWFNSQFLERLRLTVKDLIDYSIEWPLRKSVSHIWLKQINSLQKSSKFNYNVQMENRQTLTTIETDLSGWSVADSLIHINKSTSLCLLRSTSLVKLFIDSFSYCVCYANWFVILNSGHTVYLCNKCNL